MTESVGDRMSLVTSGGKRVGSVTLGSLPDLEEGLPDSAWAVWHTMLERAKATLTIPATPGQQLRWEGRLEDIMLAVWPDLGETPIAEGVAARHAISNYLRWTHNIIPVTGASRGQPPVWSVRTSWDDSAPVVPAKKPLRPEPPRPAPRTAAPEPAPAVTSQPAPYVPRVTTFKCPWPSCKEPAWDTLAEMSAHHFTAHRSAARYSIDALETMTGPATVQDIHAAALAAGFPGSLNAIRHPLNDLLDSGAVTLLDTPGPRASGLYVLATRDQQKAVLADHSGGRYPCRERGCTSPAFAQADARGRHERVMHPDTMSRPWPCNVTGCYDELSGGCERHYSVMSLTIHMTAGHGLRRGEQQYQEDLATSREQAAAWYRERGLDIPGRHPQPKGRPAPALPPADISWVQGVLTENEHLAAKVTELEQVVKSLHAKLAKIRVLS